MGILNGKKFLIFGLLNKKSIAYGISKSLYNEGAKLCFICKNIKLKNKILNIINKFKNSIYLICNLNSNKEIVNMINNVYKIWNNFDGLIYSVAYTDSKQLNGNYLLKINKKVFSNTFNINIYSFIYLIKKCIKLLNNNSSLIALTYIGSTRVLKNYNIMGPIKAALESNIKYISYSISELSKNYIRINGISSGPIYTVSSSRIKNFNKILLYYKKKSPFNKIVTIKELGNVSSFLMSDLSLGINGQIIFVDYGFNIML